MKIVVRKHGCHWIILSLVIISLITACRHKDIEIDIAAAIAQTQTAVAAVQTQTPTVVKSSTQAIPSVGRHKITSFAEFGVDFSFDEAIISKVEVERQPSNQVWLPAHQQIHSDRLGNLAEGIPDSLKFTLSETASQDPIQMMPYLIVRPVSDLDGEYYSALVDDKDLTQELDKLQTSISGRSIADRFYDNAWIANHGSPHIEVHRAYVDFKNGSGVRYITFVPNKVGPQDVTNQGIAYFFEGLTTDGNYYVELMFWVFAPVLSQNTALSGDQIQRFNDDPETYAAYISDIDWKLRVMLDNEFIPDLNLMDKMVTSLTIKPELPAPTPNVSSVENLEVSGSAIGLGEPSWIERFEKTPSYIFLGTDGYTESKVENGSLVLASLAQIGDRWRIIELPGLGDFYLQITARTGPACSEKDAYGLEKDAYGLFVRASAQGVDYNTGYVFGVSCDGYYRFYRMDEGRYFSLRDWTANSNILTGPDRTNQLGLMADGQNISLYVNGVLLEQFQDSTHPVGQFGFMISSLKSFDFKVFIDDIAFWNLYEKRIKTPTPPTNKTLFKPLPLDECEVLHAELGRRLKVTFTRSEYPFLDPLNGEARGTSCHLEFSGTGENITSWNDLLETTTVFSDLGWQADFSYDASGLERESRGFRKTGDYFALVKITRAPMEGVTCPQGQPVATCYDQLQPAQIKYSIIIDAVQKSIE